MQAKVRQKVVNIQTCEYKINTGNKMFKVFLMNTTITGLVKYIDKR